MYTNVDTWLSILVLFLAEASQRKQNSNVSKY
jgi:hypothetical protein